MYNYDVAISHHAISFIMTIPGLAKKEMKKKTCNENTPALIPRCHDTRLSYIQKKSTGLLEYNIIQNTNLHIRYSTQ